MSEPLPVGHYGHGIVVVIDGERSLLVDPDHVMNIIGWIDIDGDRTDDPTEAVTIMFRTPTGLPMWLQIKPLHGELLQ